MGIIHTVLFRRRVLVVEDSFMLAINAADVLEDAGAHVVGPVATVEQALELAASIPLDAAVYNSFLGNTRADALADFLDRQGVPSVVLSLIAACDEDPLLRAHPVIQWPFDPNHLIAALSSAVIQRRCRARLSAN